MSPWAFRCAAIAFIAGGAVTRPASAQPFDPNPSTWPQPAVPDPRRTSAALTFASALAGLGVGAGYLHDGRVGNDIGTESAGLTFLVAGSASLLGSGSFFIESLVDGGRDEPRDGYARLIWGQVLTVVGAGMLTGNAIGLYEVESQGDFDTATFLLGTPSLAMFVTGSSLWLASVHGENATGPPVTRSPSMAVFGVATAVGGLTSIGLSARSLENEFFSGFATFYLASAGLTLTSLGTALAVVGATEMPSGRPNPGFGERRERTPWRPKFDVAGPGLRLRWTLDPAFLPVDGEL